MSSEVNVIKEQVLSFINHFGYNLIKHQLFQSKSYGKVSQTKNTNLVSPEIVKDILNFYKKVPPFYFTDTIKPLKIEGAWKKNFENGRKNQLKAIESNDSSHYKNLLDNMFCNEMIYAMWEGKYYKPSIVGQKLPPLFLEWVDGYCYLTGRSVEDLYFNSIGNSWGCLSPLGIIKTIDPAQGIKAQNIINLLNLLNPPEGAVVCDIGSGFGGDMEKLARWYKKPLRIILVDVPLNLTTAYAYIQSGFPQAKKMLISDEQSLNNHLSKKVESLEFIFIPTLFVEALQSTKIHVLHNHGSFSEMNKPTIDFYLNILVNDRTDFLIEINSNKPALLAKSHLEVASNNFCIPKTHCLLSKNPTWLTPKGHRYLNSIYANKNLKTLS